MQLTNQNINQTVEEITGFLDGAGVSRKDRIRICLLLEEALLRFQSELGETTEYSVVTRKWGAPKVLLRVKGDRIDPLARRGDGSSDPDDPEALDSVFLRNLLDPEAVKAAYQYRNGHNEVTATAGREGRKLRIPGGAITIAVLAGVAAALISKQLPATVHGFLLNDVAAPLLSALLGLILLATGPLIFCSVVSGICALDDISTLSTLGSRVIRRFFIITVLLAAFTAAVSLLFFPGISGSSAGAFQPAELVQMLIALIPQDLFSPFAEGKTIQVVILAILTGTAILILGGRVPRLKEFVAEANSLVFQVMKIISKVIPLAVFLSIFKAIAANSLQSILGVWKVIAANYLASVPFCVLMLLWVTLRHKVSARDFLHQCSPVLLIAFSSASGSIAMARNFEVCKENLGIDSKLCDFWIPLSHAMFSPSVVTPLVVAAFYSSAYYGKPISAMQLLIVFILVVQLSIASPKVPGGIMATFTILLNQMGMPLDAVGLLMVANVFCVNAETMFGMLIRNLDLVDLAESMKLRYNK